MASIFDACKTPELRELFDVDTLDYTTTVNVDRHAMFCFRLRSMHRDSCIYLLSKLT